MAQTLPLAPEGFTDALAKKLGKEYGSVRVVIDCGLVVMAALLSFLFLGRVIGVREGTIVAALLIGNCSKWFSRRYSSVLNRYCHKGSTSA